MQLHRKFRKTIDFDLTKSVSVRSVVILFQENSNLVHGLPKCRLYTLR